MSSILLLVFLFSAFCACLHESQGIQLDVVFPQDKATYKPVYPFPIVFAFHNLSRIATKDVQLIWRLVGLDPPPSPGIQDFGRRLLDHSLLSYPDELLILNSTREILNSTTGTFNLNYLFEIDYDCFDNITRPEYNRTYGRGGTVQFKLSHDGDIPDILPAGPYAQPLLSIGYEGDLTNSTGGVCHSIFEKPVQANALKIDEALASRVSSAMMATVSCTAGSWPNNLTDLPSHYPYECPSKSEINMSVGRDTVGVMFIVVLAATLGFLRVFLL
ncbi:hypothetical protein MferCBS31731_005632 [Microsporum ferrugineum]